MKGTGSTRGSTLIRAPRLLSSNGLRRPYLLAFGRRFEGVFGRPVTGKTSTLRSFLAVARKQPNRPRHRFTLASLYAYAPGLSSLQCTQPLATSAA